MMKRMFPLVLAAAIALTLPLAAQAAKPMGHRGKGGGIPPTSGMADSTHVRKAPAAPRVDLNAAPKEDLTKLPGIDDATADKIIAGRPFKSRHDLVTSKILSEAQYGKIKNLVTVMKAPPQK